MDYRTWAVTATILVGACTADPEDVVDMSVTRLAGIYNVTETNDSTNIELLEDGTFRTVSHGCDYDGNDAGVWALEDGNIILRPSGASRMNWADGVCPGQCLRWSYQGLGYVTEEVRLEPEDDSWRAFFTDGPGEDQVQGQLVNEGGVCVFCGDGYAPCEDPFSHDPWGEG